MPIATAVSPPFGRITLDALGHALTHFARSLVGEGNGRDVLGFVSPARDQVRDFLGDDARLAAARASEYQQGAVGVFDG